MKTGNDPRVEYTVIWHGASWREDDPPRAAQKVDQHAGRQHAGRPVGGVYGSDANATRSGHFRKDDEK